MIKIYPRISSIIGATLDRYDVRFANRLQKDDIGKTFVKKLVAESGKSSNNPFNIIRNWFRAYNANLKKNMMIDNIEKSVKKSQNLDKTV